MKAALRRISGEGEFEKEWNRLFGSNRGRSTVCEFALYAGGLWVAGAAEPNVETDRLGTLALLLSCLLATSGVLLVDMLRLLSCAAIL